MRLFLAPKWFPFLGGGKQVLPAAKPPVRTRDTKAPVDTPIRTPLHLAASEGDSERVAALLFAGAYSMCVHADGSTRFTSPHGRAIRKA